MICASYQISIRRQCALLSINRSSIYKPRKVALGLAALCQKISDIYEAKPVYGYRRITDRLKASGLIINRKKVQRLMRVMNLQAVYPGPNTSKRNLQEMVHPYLLKGLAITSMHQVWQIDITYIRTEKGFMYLSALIDVYSRLVVGWDLSNNLSVDSCKNSLLAAIAEHGTPGIVNSDQGSQFTSNEWINLLQAKEITISMTGKGRCNDNAYIERLWRTLKYEGIYLHQWKTVRELKQELPKLIYWYNNDRPHQSLRYRTPSETSRAFMDNLKPSYPQLHSYNN